MLTRTTLFLSNRSQAVRLPKMVAFGEQVRDVVIVSEGGGFEEPLFGKVGSYFSSFGVLIDCFCDGIRSAF
ncbi:Soluble pyridine nucleotide transhydrogenase [Acetobacter malorum]|nr:Soluble pyridine nucleotide transhydrogenase [Acetobacter malorum]